MKSRPKDLGTAMETRVVRAAQAAGLVAERIAEGGANDLGDVRIWGEHEWVIECRDRQNMNVHQALEKALRKSATSHTAVVWRRMVRRDGRQLRTQEGPVLVAMTLPAFLELVGGEE